MKHAAPCLPLLLLGACAAAPHDRADALAGWNGRIESWGTLREALHDGEVEGRVVLADVARTGTYGVGALEGLRGEVTIVDGTVWVSEGSGGGGGTNRAGAARELATVLFAARVQSWSEVAVDEDVHPSELEAFVAARARSVGLDPSQPFPFLVEGGLQHLDLHVIAGACPIRSRMLGEPSTASELHSDRVEGRLVGIYAPDSSGVVCHMGTKLHAHAVIEQDGGLTGHVESVGLARGSVLKLPRRGSSVTSHASPGAHELDEVELEALRAALDDERRSLATYDRVIEDFGPVRPFIHIREAEARHIGALTTLFERYGVDLPEDRWRAAAPRFATVGEACRAAVEAEKENAGLYDRLLASTRQPDIRRVFGNLREASLERHLPAFQRCAGRR